MPYYGNPTRILYSVIVEHQVRTLEAHCYKVCFWVFGRLRISFSFCLLPFHNTSSAKSLENSRSGNSMGKVAIVVDNGSAFSRSGFAGEDKPRIAMKTTYLPPSHSVPVPDNQPHAQIGSGMHSTKEPKPHPLKHGIITDWEAMENLWSHLFYCGLKVPPEEHPMLMSDSPSCPTTNREKMAEVLFEGFAVPALYVANTGFLSLCSCGRVTGLAVESGAGVSHVTPIYAGKTWIEGTHRLDVAGRFLSRYLHRLLVNSSNNPEPFGTLNKKTVVQIKKHCCYVSMDFERDLQANTCQYPTSIETPDGHLIVVAKERFCCPEPLFKPNLLNQNSPGLHLLAFQSLQIIPDEYKREVMNNIVLSGGSSMFPGFPERMRLEMDALFFGKGYPIKLLTAPKNSVAAWIGGSLAASLSSFQQFWMTKEDYQEHGTAFVHEKFE